MGLGLNIQTYIRVIPAPLNDDLHDAADQLLACPQLLGLEDGRWTILDPLHLGVDFTLVEEVPNCNVQQLLELLLGEEGISHGQEDS